MIAVPAAPAGAHGSAAGTLASFADVVTYGVVRPDPVVEPGKTGAQVDTVWTVDVGKPVKGVSAAAVKVRIPGGDMGDGTAVLYPSEGFLRAGESVLLFLNEQGQDGAFRLALGRDGAVHEKVLGANGLEHNPRFDGDPQKLTVGAECDSTHPARDGYAGFFPLDNGYGLHAIQTSNMAFVVNSGFAGNTSAVDMAISKWNSAGGTFRYSRNTATTTPSAMTSGDGFSTIGWGTTSRSSALAQAVVRSVISTGAITEVDIIFNQAKPFSPGTTSPTSTQYDTVAVMLHETGHGLGLEHVTDNTSVMATCVLSTGNNTRRDLSYGDLAGHRNFYPPDDKGYWLVDEAGAVYGLGGLNSWNHYNAPYYGGANQNNVIGYPGNKATDVETAMPTRRGYYILASNGGVFAYGSGARFKGSAAGNITGSAVDMTLDPANRWYWILGSDGGVFSYPVAPDPNPAPFYGSGAGGMNGPAVGIAATADGGGYWIVTDKGSVYSYGNARWLGGTIPSSSWPAKGIVRTVDGGGYWILGANGQVHAYGNASAYYVDVNPNARKISRDPRGNNIVDINNTGFVEFGGSFTDYGRGTTPTPYSAIGATRAPTTPTLTLSASPTSITVRRGSTGTSTLTVASNDTFYSTVSFSVSGAPSGVSASVSPTSLMLPSSSSRTATLNVTPSATYAGASTFTLTVTACGQGICRTQDVAVVVTVV